MDMPIDVVRHEQAIAHILEELRQGRGGWAITPNLDQLRLYRRRPELRGMYERAELVLADGMPLLWASRLAGSPLPERVPGSEIIYTLTAAAASAGRSIFLLGGNPGAADGAAAELQHLNLGLKVVGTLCPPIGFEKDTAQMRLIEESLRAACADIVYVGLGFPKQENLIAALQHFFPRTWFLGVGVSFSFVAGEIRRAPRWLQRIGLEWVHRMAQEPRRLFVRYVVNDLPFAVRLFANAILTRLKRPANRPPH